MMIDFHTHTFPDAMAAATIEHLKTKSHTQNYADGTAADLSRREREAGVDLAVVLPVVTNPAKASKINRASAEINRSTADTGIMSFGGIHPDTENTRTVLREAKELGLCGIKIHPAYQGVNFNDIRFKRIVSAAEEEGLITVTHAGIDIGIDGSWCSPDMVRELYKDVRPQRLVLAHMGGWLQWDEVYDKICGLDVYFDTCFSHTTFNYLPGTPDEIKAEPLTRRRMIELIIAHGAGKILFGTDSPWDDIKPQIDMIRSLPISESEKSAILGDNARALLGLE